TGREDSVKEIKKKKQPTSTCETKNSSKTHGRDLALETYRNFQEVKVCVANLNNGMTERKVVLTSIYPHDQPPKPYISDVLYPRRKKSSYTTLKNANSIERLPPREPLSDDDLLKSPDRSLRSVHCAPPASSSSQQYQLLPTSSKYPSTLYRDRALSTITQLRGHYQLTNDEIRILSKNPDLKIITMRAGISLQEAQRNLRNLKRFQILAGKHLLPDLTLFSDELSVVILELDRFIDAIHTVSEHADPSPKGKKYRN
uniref:Uncharacterized protein n=1 Tax=Panagrolaimus sp. ES5 TaxID=591445 RepID=A0AC34GBB0_9BILA